jgi:hypothetical protein
MIATLAAALVLSTAMAQSFDAPTMKVGDYFSYQASGGHDKPNVWTETVVEVLRGGRYRVRVDGGPQPGLREFDGPWNVVQIPPWPSLKFLHFPLAVGKSWKHAVDDTPAQRRTIDYKAVAIETRTVAGQALECLRIEGVETTGNATFGIPSATKLWYCPAARAVVRKENRIPLVERVIVELTDFKLAP